MERSSCPDAEGLAQLFGGQGWKNEKRSKEREERVEK